MPIGQGSRNNNILGSLGRTLLFDTNIKATTIGSDIFTDQEVLETVAAADLLLILDVSATPNKINYITRANFRAGLPSLTGSTNNTLVTVTGAEAITGEANLTFDGTAVLQIGADSNIEPRLDLLNDENSFQLGIANGSGDMISGSADGDIVFNSVGDHNILFSQNDTLSMTIDADGDLVVSNNITSDGGEIEIDISSGDPHLSLQIGGTDKFTIGVDDSDNDNLKIDTGGTVGGGTQLTMDSSGNTTLAANLTIGGLLKMPSNTASKILVADGTSFEEVDITGLSAIASIASDDVFIALDTSGGGLKKVERSVLVSGLATSSAISNVSEDSTPQLGGSLDVNGEDIVS